MRAQPLGLFMSCIVVMGETTRNKVIVAPLLGGSVIVEPLKSPYAAETGKAPR